MSGSKPIAAVTDSQHDHHYGEHGQYEKYPQRDEDGGDGAPGGEVVVLLDGEEAAVRASPAKDEAHDPEDCREEGQDRHADQRGDDEWEYLGGPQQPCHIAEVGGVERPGQDDCQRGDSLGSVDHEYDQERLADGPPPNDTPHGGDRVYDYTDAGAEESLAGRL